MHAFFAPFGSMPNNAIVGGSGDISVGAALFKQINRQAGHRHRATSATARPRCGPVWEGIMLAAMDQYRTLWPKEAGGAPPILFNFFNNFYGMGGQTFGETMGFKVLARIGAGVNPEQMHAERVDGYNPLAVADAIERKKKILLEGKGPVLLDVVTYRFSGHSPSDASSYRSKEEIAAWQDADCIKAYGAHLVSERGRRGGRPGGDPRQRARAPAARDGPRDVARDWPRVGVPVGSPGAWDAGGADPIGDLMFSNGNVERMADRKSRAPAPRRRESARAAPSRRSPGRASVPTASPLPKAQVVSLRDAIFEAVLPPVRGRPDHRRPGARRTGTGAAPSPSTAA